MKRTMTSAKQAGSRFERALADYLAVRVDDRIDRRVRNGDKDRGDIGGVRTPHGKRVVIEAKDCRPVALCTSCRKDTTQPTLGTWAREADIERGNDDALVGLVVHKRHGVLDPADQWVTMTVRDLVALLTGVRPE